VQPWPYSERDRFDDLLARLSALRARIAAMAKDEITPAERDAITAAEKDKAQALFDSLKREVEQNKRK